MITDEQKRIVQDILDGNTFPLIRDDILAIKEYINTLLKENEDHWIARKQNLEDYQKLYNRCMNAENQLKEKRK